MRKKSKYKPKGVRLDNLSWISAGFKKVGSLPTAGVALKLKNHEALEAVLKGYATRDHVDVLISAFNMAEALYRIKPELGIDWKDEIKVGQDAIFTMARRGLKFNKFIFTGTEMAATKLVMSIHDQQLDDCVVREMEDALLLVAECVKHRRARAVVETI